MTQSEKALKLHEEWNGKITTTPKCEVKKILPLPTHRVLQNHVK